MTPEKQKSVLRGALAIAKITELEAMVLVSEIFEEERARRKNDQST